MNTNQKSRSMSDQLLSDGAQELISTCLGVSEADSVLVLTDAATFPVADYIHRASEQITHSVVELLPSLNDDYAAAFERIEQRLNAIRPSVVVFAAEDDEDLLAWDERYWQKLKDLEARSAQMPALDAHCLGAGMAADYREVARFTQVVTDRVQAAREIEVVNELGTNITFACDPARPWTPFTGLYHEGGSGGRLPQGETFCSPISANGTIAASVIGYPFNASTRLLSDPVRLEIEDSRVVEISHTDSVLIERLEAWFAQDEHANRIGEFALGTNRGCEEIMGNLLFDENVPGCHIALGHPFGDYTGADWASRVHVDLVVARPNIRVDGSEIIHYGTYCEQALARQNGART